MGIRHKFESQDSDDGLRAGAIKPSNWNEDHVIDGALGALASLPLRANSLAYIDDQMQAQLAALTPVGRALLSAAVVSDVLAYLGVASNANTVLTGVPIAPTPPRGTNTNQIATMAAIQDAINALVGGAPGALDTLKEIADALNDDANFAATFTNALANRLRLDVPQNLTSTVQAMGRANLGIANYDTIADLSAATITAPVQSVRTAGFYAAGDGGAGHFIRKTALDAGAFGRQSADGAWWQLVVERFGLSIRQTGAKGDGATFDAAAIQAACNAVDAAGGGIVYGPKGRYLIARPATYTTAALQASNKVMLWFDDQAEVLSQLGPGGSWGWGGGLITNKDYAGTSGGNNHIIVRGGTFRTAAAAVYATGDFSNGSNVVSNLRVNGAASVDGILANMGVFGTGSPTVGTGSGTVSTVVSVNPTAKSLQMSLNANATRTSATIAAAGAFTTATTVIPMAAGAGTVQAGMAVYDLTTGKRIGVVASYTGTNMTLATAAAFASGGSADSLYFGQEIFIGWTGGPFFDFNHVDELTLIDVNMRDTFGAGPINALNVVTYCALLSSVTNFRVLNCTVGLDAPAYPSSIYYGSTGGINIAGGCRKGLIANYTGRTGDDALSFNLEAGRDLATADIEVLGLNVDSMWGHPVRVLVAAGQTQTVSGLTFTGIAGKANAGAYPPNPGCNGIVVEDKTNSGKVYDIKFNGVDVDCGSNGDGGFVASYVVDLSADKIKMKAPFSNFMRLTNCTRPNVLGAKYTGGQRTANPANGVEITNCTDPRFGSSVILNAKGHGLLINACTDGVFDVNTVRGSVFHGIVSVGVTGTAFVANKSAGNGAYGITDDGTCDYNRYIGNDTRGNTSGGLSVSGTHNGSAANI